MVQFIKAQLDIKPHITKKPRVLIDLDGVVRDFVGSLVRAYKRQYPHHEILPINSRRLEDFFPIGPDIYKFTEPGAIEKIIEDAPTYPGALEALNQWSAEFDIIIVSAQPEISRSSTFIWVGKKGIPTSEVHITYDKSAIDGIALLDDFIDNLHKFKQTNRLAVCLDQPWNQEWNGPRVKSVSEFFEFIYPIIHENNEGKIEDKFLT